MTKPSTRCPLLPGQLRMPLAERGPLFIGILVLGLLPMTVAAGPQLKLPGLTVNVAERCVDIQAAVCLDKGLLEVVACTKGTKEHESIVVVEATPMHIHTALLVLGATNGHPAMRRPREPEGTGWIDIPPSGDPIGVSLVFQDDDGEMVEHGISEFVAVSAPDGGAGDGREAAVFPKKFLFAGSHLRENDEGPRTYLADESGNVISIATFGDELLCMDGIHGHANNGLMWQINPENLPPVGAKVTLRLRVR